MYETFDHTADLGLRVRAPELHTLFEEAAGGLFSLIVEDPESVEARETAEITIVGDDRAFLLVDWLRELLVRFDADGMLFRDFSVRLTADGLDATVRGEPLDRDRHPLSHEVKAITSHGLCVEPDPDGGWVAEVIVDI